MDNLRKYTLDSILLKAISLSVTCILLFLGDHACCGWEAALQQAPFLVITATLFFALSLASHAIYQIVMRRGGSIITGFYKLCKVVRLFLAIAILMIYAIANRQNLLAFSLNLLALYTVSMVTTIIYYAKVEHNISKKQ